MNQGGHNLAANRDVWVPCMHQSKPLWEYPVPVFAHVYIIKMRRHISVHALHCACDREQKACMHDTITQYTREHRVRTYVSDTDARLSMDRTPEVLVQSANIPALGQDLHGGEAAEEKVHIQIIASRRNRFVQVSFYS